MSREFNEFTLREKLIALVSELVEKELPIREALKELEKLYIETAAKKYKGNKTRIAKALGIHRNTLHNLYKALNIKP
jgi:DNA-binding NtrC family response regulator